LDKLKTVRDSKPSSKIKEIRQFMGLCNFFGLTSATFVKISAPLNRLTTIEANWKGGELPEN
jgi:hypothetical protein